MKIRLSDIPEDGRQYILNRNTAELNEVLKDLIQNQSYQVDLFIRPLNSKDFEITGTVKAQAPELCSRCAEDFLLPIDKTIKEILIPSQQDDRTGKYAKSTTPISEDLDSVSVSTYKNNQFELGEFIHEAVALEVPFNPAPPCNANGDCSLCLKSSFKKPFIYDEKMSEEVKENPFNALKTLKLN